MGEGYVPRWGKQERLKQATRDFLASTKAEREEFARDQWVKKQRAAQRNRTDRTRTLAVNPIAVPVPAPQPAVPQKTHIYIVTDGLGAVKVGIAKDPFRRLSGLQTASPRVLSLRAKYEVVEEIGRKVEKQVHKRLQCDRIMGEWFAIEPERAAEVVELVIAEVTAKLEKLRAEAAES